MASNTAVSEARRARNHQKSGARRKKKESQHSTPSLAELFAGFGEPGKPAEKGGAAPKKAAAPAAQAAPKAAPKAVKKS